MWVVAACVKIQLVQRESVVASSERVFPVAAAHTVPVLPVEDLPDGAVGVAVGFAVLMAHRSKRS